MARPILSDQAVNEIHRSLDDVDAGHLSAAQACSKSHVEIPSSLVTRSRDTTSKSSTQTDTRAQIEKPHKHVLCLDGGGIRGISALLILQSIMENIRDLLGLPETPRPCDYFGLIGGTSTGARIIAIMIGPLRMTVAQCLKAYKAMAQRAFTATRSGYFSWLPQLPGRPDGIFSATCLEEAVKDIVEDYKGDKEALFADQDCCKTVVLAVTKVDVGAPPTKFKTYDIGDDFRDCKIWEIARATAATLTFFPSMPCGKQEIEFINAESGHNNPTEVLLSEAQDLFPDEICGSVISIGTGLSGVITIEDKRLSILKALKRMATNSEAVHQRVAKRLPEDIYFRFNVTKGLDDVTLSDWDKSSKISAHTANYLAEIDVQRAIKQCARILTKGYSAPAFRLGRDPQNQSSLFRKRMRFDDCAMISNKDIRQQYYIAWAFRLQQNLPPQVLLSDPVVVYDALDNCFPFFLEWVASAEAFVAIMEETTRSCLEETYKSQGSAKIRRREFILHDLEAKRRFNLEQHTWSFIMRPGKTRHMSMTFREINAAWTSCPRCGAENTTNEDEMINCENFETMYERIVEIEDEHENTTSAIGSESHSPESVETRKRKRGLPNELDLKRVFRRLTLLNKAPRPHTSLSLDDDDGGGDDDDDLPFLPNAAQANQGDGEEDTNNSSESTDEILDTNDFWPPAGEAKKGPANMAIEVATPARVVPQVPKTAQVNRPGSEMPQRRTYPRGSVVIWTCHECGDSGMTLFLELCATCGHGLCRNCETYLPM